MFSQKIDKPWGHEEIWANEPEYVGKFLFINNGHSLSRQYHNYKKETITVLSGTVTVELGDENNITTIKLDHGKTITINPLDIHRFKAEDGDVCVVEVSTNFLDDVVRLKDFYNRS